MVTIVDTIRLKPGVDPERFERWVRETDYASCPELPSIIGFAVTRVDGEVGPGVHYFEVIQVESAAAFEADMASATFQRLVAEFSEMAEVVATLSGPRIEPGYARAA